MLIKQMAQANPLWGAPRIHGELQNLGLEVSERTVSRLMPRRREAPSQSWRTFLDNHIGAILAIDFFTVPTASFVSLRRAGLAMFWECQTGVQKGYVRLHMNTRAKPAMDTSGRIAWLSTGPSQVAADSPRR